MSDRYRKAGLIAGALLALATAGWYGLRFFAFGGDQADADADVGAA